MNYSADVSADVIQTPSDPQHSVETPLPAASVSSGEVGQPHSRQSRPVGTNPALGTQRKSVFLACCLSLLPGIGQVYVGYYKLGFIHNIVFASTLMLIVIGSPLEALIPVFSIFLAFFFVYNIVDAGRRAAFYNLALDGVEGIELPDDMNFEFPSFGGSIAGGVALMVLGGIFLSNTLFDISLAWVEDWWPVAPIVFGAYLVVKARQETHEQD